MSHTATLFNPQQAHEVITSLWVWAKPRLIAGHKMTLTLKEQPRTLPQNDHIQRLVRSIGVKIGNKDHDRLRMLLVEQWRHETGRKPQHCASFDGLRMIDVGNSTSAMDKAEGSEFIEWLLATDSEL